MSLTQEQEAYLKHIKRDVEERLSAARVCHVYGVVSCAQHLAREYGVDEFAATAAAYLHDWDKELSADKLLSLAEAYEIDLPDDPNKVIPLLHSWTGAFSAMMRYPELPDEVFIAIARHTTGAASMSKLDMVLYCADMLEPSRKVKSLTKIAKHIGEVSLDELYVQCYTKTIQFLLKKRRYIYPPAIEIWNVLISRHRAGSGHREESSGSAALERKSHKVMPTRKK